MVFLAWLWTWIEAWFACRFRNRRRSRGRRRSTLPAYCRTQVKPAGVRHQRTEPGCPWQNGRIERLFGTLKQKLDQWEVAGFEALNDAQGSWTLLGHLFLAIGKYGKPRALRTDNEACFVSRTFRVALALAGVRHQRSDPGCP
jgi:transposase InsO family protein